MGFVITRGDPDFIFLAFQDIDLGIIANPGLVPAVNESEVREIKISLPPLAEQSAIAAHLDGRIAAIDAAIAYYERMAELVSEYWARLAADAVTGHMDVRAAV